MALSPIVDCHAHLAPTPLLRLLADRTHGLHGFDARLAERGWVVDVPGRREPLPVPPKMVDHDLRLQWCADQGIGTQMLSPWMDIQPTHTMPRDSARDWARRLNACMLETASADGHRRPTLGTVAVHDPELAAQDLRDVVEVEGLTGLILSTDPPGQPSIATRELDVLWDAAEELDVPVMLHPPTDGPSSQLPGINGYGNVYGRLVDTTLAGAKLVLGGVLDRHPRLKLILVHGGGFLPFQVGRLDGGHRLPPLDQHELDRETPSAYLGDLYFDTVALSQSAIRFLAQLVGSRQLLFGSDYPFTLGGPDPAGTVRTAGLAEAELHDVLCGTATSLFSRNVRV